MKRSINVTNPHIQEIEEQIVKKRKLTNEDYKCMECEKIYKYERNLQRHQDKNHPKKHKIEYINEYKEEKKKRTTTSMGKKTTTFECFICDKKYNHQTSLNRHINNNHSFSGKKSLENQKEKETTRNQKEYTTKEDYASIYKCNICDKEFNNITNFETHTKRCGQQSKYFCDKCSFSTTAKRSLRRHYINQHKSNLQKKMRTVNDNQNTCNKGRPHKMKTSDEHLLKKITTEREHQLQNLVIEFKKKCNDQPIYICTSCHRLLWKRSVRKMSIENYKHINTTILKEVLHIKYRRTTIDGSIYICRTCDRYLLKGKYPPQSKANGMELEEIPDELKDLNTLEQRLISKRIPFMKIVKLPRGGQYGLKGPAINVPANLDPACALLPRIPETAHFVPLKIKRKLQYIHSYMYDAVRPQKVMAALRFLKDNNPFYSDVKINHNWIHSWQQDDKDVYNGLFHIEENIPKNNKSKEKKITKKRKQKNIKVALPLYSPDYCKLQQILLLHGLHTINVPGDGDCMLHSIVHQRYIHKMETLSVLQIRKKVVKYMKMNTIKYKDFIVTDNRNITTEIKSLIEKDKTLEEINCKNIRQIIFFNSYLETLSKKGTWCDHIVLQALCDLFQISAVIYEIAENNSLQTTKIHPENIPFEETQHTFHLGFLREYHYTSIITEEQFENNATNYSKDEHSSSSDTDHEQNKEDIEDNIATNKKRELNGLPHETCLQSEFTDPTLTYILAPAEGKKPMSIFTDENFEILSNPDKFPSGKFGFNYKRKIPLSIKKYGNARLEDVDGRCARDMEYVMSTTYAMEQKQVTDQISIAMRQKKQTMQGVKLTASMLRTNEQIKNILVQNRAYMFLKKIRGSPPYWQQLFYETLSMIRTIGKPDLFLTISAAEMMWPELIQAIGAQYGHKFTKEQVEQMTWTEKSKWLASNPVTAARMFQYRLETFMSSFLQDKSNPIGEIKDYVIRIEFQARGSPHAHMLLWLKDAPTLETHTEQEVCRFIDSIITCELPKNNNELKELVTSLQIHSHSFCCRRSGKCRFHFPRPPSPHTCISQEIDQSNVATLRKSLELLKKVHTLSSKLGYNCGLTLEDVLHSANIKMEDYIDAICTSTTGVSIILKREIGEQNINGYNPYILSAWRANMDLQFIMNIYGCIMYMVSYVLKAEKGMGELLQEAAKEVQREEIRKQFQKLGSVFLNNREVSSQESCYRGLPLPLRKCTRETIFIPVDTKENRIMLLKPIAEINTLDDNDTNIYCTTLLDKYASRPQKLEEMTLAEFATHYKYISKNKGENKKCNEINDNSSEDENEFTKQNNSRNEIIELQNNLGYMIKRTKPAIIRWHTFNILKETEKYFRSRILLFTHWRNEETLKLHYNSFEERYLIEIEEIQKVEKQFIKDEKIIDNALQKLYEDGIPELAWDRIDSITQGQNLEDTLHPEDNKRHIDDEDIRETIKSLIHKSGKYNHSDVLYNYATEINKDILSPKEYNEYFINSNPKQRTPIVHHRHWLKDTIYAIKNNLPIHPYYLFLSGPGGVGKSYVLKMIYTDTIRMFRNCYDISPTDVTCLLTASTGVAAHNIEGMTIHKALCLTDLKRTDKGYYQLNDERLNELQSKLDKLYVIIIDEISMIGAETLYKIHMRLQEIKGLTKENTRFGNITIIAVGDLYQLPPCKEHKIFNLPGSITEPNPLILHESLWKENFQLHELTTVVRQKDKVFADLLNRVRIGILTDEDEQILLSRVTTMDSPEHDIFALHIFGRNKDAEEYNKFMLKKLKYKTISCECIDLCKSLKQTELKKLLSPLNRSKTGGLETSLTLAEEAIIRITSNINVEDGLANGIRGKIKKIMMDKEDQQIIKVLLVEFDNPKIGVQAKNNSDYKSTYPTYVPIYRFASPFKVKQSVTVIRHQFPVILAWGSTIHSVQGITVDRIVVDLLHIFACGQTYIGLSRVTNIPGLQILNYNRKAFKSDSIIEKEMERLRTRTLQFKINQTLPTKNTDYLNISCLNIRGLLPHLNMIKQEETIISSNIMCYTETHLNSTHQLPTNGLMKEEYKTFRTDRSTNHTRGGTLITCENTLKPKENIFNIRNLEYTSITILTKWNTEITVCVIYRSILYNKITDFLITLQDLILQIQEKAEDIIILGDFNEDIAKSTTILNFLTQKGFQQLITKSTTDYGSILDHVYMYSKNITYEITIKDIFFSDHDQIILCIQPKNN